MSTLTPTPNSYLYGPNGKPWPDFPPEMSDLEKKVLTDMRNDGFFHRAYNGYISDNRLYATQVLPTENCPSSNTTE
jgi:hypothetical protein